uniref:hypothetical protein n=1 Tax=Trichocoleus desertorum TaxID=1481672 RepID=UPI0025B5BA7D|nr:hypothetical protein [Trichocoleus desertorum]
MPKAKSLEPLFVLNPQRAAALLDISTDTLDRYRIDSQIGWIQGVHWFQLPRGGYRYNKEMLEDWLANLHDPETHQRAVEHFRASLLSSRGRRSLKHPPAGQVVEGDFSHSPHNA